MLPIVLTVLKIIGIVILSILGFVIFVLFLVFLVPVRYSLSGSYGSDIKAKAKITWLLHALSVGITYEDGLDIAVRILGKRLFQKTEHEPLESPKEDLEDLPEGEPDMETCSLGTEEFPQKEEKKRMEKTGKRNSASSKEKANLTERLQRLAESLKGKWNRIAEYKEKITAFVTDEENKKTFRIIWRQFRAVIRHIFPTKARGTLVFGFEDPSTTGSVLAALSILYAWYGDALRITPIFDEKILEVDGSLKGRIRAGTFFVLLIRILLNKNFRVLVRRWRRNGGIL